MAKYTYHRNNHPFTMSGILKASCFILVFILVFILIIFSHQPLTFGKEKSPKIATAENKTAQLPNTEKALSDVNKSLPKISFEKTVHDFSQLAVKEKGKCEFKFKNTGQAPLKIERIKMTCACGFHSISKRVYKPGEEGVIKINYKGERKPGSVKHPIFVKTNDQNNPSVKLTIKAKVILHVEAIPDKLTLSLEQENAGIPLILLKSIDDKPFFIKNISVTNDVITADFDPNISENEITLEPMVDIEKLKNNMKGKINISVTHPKCKLVTIAYEAPSQFEIQPRRIIFRNSDPNRPGTKEIIIKSKKNKHFEIESITSKEGITKVLSQDPNNSQIKLKLQVTPPPKNNKSKYFKDAVIIKIKNGERLAVGCTGIYRRK